MDGGFYGLQNGRDVMRRCRYLRVILLAVKIGLFPAGAPAHTRNSPTYDGRVAFGSQLLYLDDDCLSVDGTLTAGDFFDHLKRTDMHGQPEYRKRGRIVGTYPESVSVSIRLIA